MKKISRNIPTSQQDPNSSFSGNVVSSPLRGYSSGAATMQVSYESTSVPEQYPHRFSLYLQAPDYEIGIEDFESLALNRLERKSLFTRLF